MSSIPSTGATPNRFARTPSTWLAYLLVGYFMYVQASLGPILPFLREDLSLGYAARPETRKGRGVDPRPEKP